MNNKKSIYLKIFAIVILVLVGVIANHLFVDFKIPEICQVADWVGDPPSYCIKGRISFEMKNFDGENTALLFIVDGIIIFLGALAVKERRLKS